MTQLQEKLKRLGACRESIEWVADRTPEEAWNECVRADYLMWAAARMSLRSQRLAIIRAALQCSRMAWVSARQLGDGSYLGGAINSAFWLADDDDPKSAALWARECVVWAIEMVIEAKRKETGEISKETREVIEARTHRKMCFEIRAIVRCPLKGAKGE